MVYNRCRYYWQIYLVAEDRVLRIDFSAVRNSGATADVLFGPEPGQAAIKIIGISVGTLSSCVYINLLHRGLFAYTFRGELLWSVGPVLNQFGYRLGCRRNTTDCSFTSVPVIDNCEANIYVKFPYHLISLYSSLVILVEGNQLCKHVH